jgi:hypothetical protein
MANSNHMQILIDAFGGEPEQYYWVRYEEYDWPDNPGHCVCGCKIAVGYVWMHRKTCREVKVGSTCTTHVPGLAEWQVDEIQTLDRQLAADRAKRRAAVRAQMQAWDVYDAMVLYSSRVPVMRRWRPMPRKEMLEINKERTDAHDHKYNLMQDVASIPNPTQEQLESIKKRSCSIMEQLDRVLIRLNLL